MVGHELNETTIELLVEALPDAQNVDARVRYLLEAELLRTLGKHRRVNAAFVNKYGMEFAEFLDSNMVHQRDYAWEVERDAMAWEAAIGAIEMLEKQLRELKTHVGTDDREAPRASNPRR
jgi:hypothetical protein